ncbi:MAG TPA: NUDIX domain-containing protein [Patescibacteria group bacterium]|nr:NUDIX domain-containing protein [Patescibacteria group bacterium]
MKKKRLVSILLPIRIQTEIISVFLQRRSSDMKLSNHFGFWGGGCEEGETPEQGLVREVKEELGFNLDIKRVELFNHYEFLGSIKNVYIFTPENDWEKGCIIGEGDYGQWFKTNEALVRDDIILEDKVVLNDLERHFLKSPIK